MVKTPHTRHSKSAREPVTIDLSPGEVSRTRAEAEQKPAAAASDKKPEAAPVEQKAEAPRPVPPRDEKPEPAKPQTATSSSASAASSSFGRADKPATPTPPPPAAEKPRGSLIPGALAGGLVALLVAGGLSYSGLLPTQGASTAPQEDTAGPAIAALESEIATLREQIAALPASGTDDTATTERIAALEQRIEGFAADIESVRTAVAQTEGSVPAFDPAPIEQRLAALETSLTELRDGGVNESALAALREEIGAVRNAQSEAANRLTALEQSIGDLNARVDEAAESPATAIIIAASSLKAAIDRGTPFMTELETYASLKPDAPEIAELRAMAAAGVPTRTQIAGESDAAVNAMIAAAQPVDPNAGVFDRLAASAMGLVQVRPVGMVEGSGVPETAARIDAAVQAGDFDRAIGEFDTLPPEAKAAGEAFIARVKARAAADRLVDGALAAALQK